jgi:hypothetical protein
MGSPTGLCAATFMPADVVETILRLTHLYLDDALDSESETEFLNLIPTTNQKAKQLLLEGSRDTASRHRLAVLVMWAYTEQLLGTNNSLAGLVHSAKHDIEDLQACERQCMLEWSRGLVQEPTALIPPAVPSDYTRIMGVLETGLGSLMNPSPVEIYHRSVCALRVPREQLLHGGDTDGIARRMSFVLDPDLRAALYDQLLRVGVVELTVLLNKQDPMTLWVALIGLLMIRQKNEVEYAVDVEIIRPPNTPITAWLLPKTKMVGVRWGKQQWKVPLKTDSMLDLAYAVLSHGDNTRMLLDKFI